MLKCPDSNCLVIHQANSIDSLVSANEKKWHKKKGAEAPLSNFFKRLLRNELQILWKTLLQGHLEAYRHSIEELYKAHL